MNIVQIYDTTDDYIESIYQSEQKFFNLAPVTFYKLDGHYVVSLFVENDTLKIVKPRNSLPEYKKLDTIGNELLTLAKDFKTGERYLFDLNTNKIIHPVYDWTIYPPFHIKEKKVEYFLLKSSNKKFYLFYSLVSSYVSILFAQGQIANLIKDSTPISEETKLFMLNLVAKQYSLSPIDILESALKDVVLKPTVEKESFPKEYLVDIEKIGKQVLEKRNKYTQVSIVEKDVLERTVLLSDLATKNIHFDIFPVEIIMDLPMNACISKMYVSDDNTISVFHYDGDIARLSDKLLEALPGYIFNIISNTENIDFSSILSQEGEE